MPTPLILPRAIRDEMIAHAKALAPHECCGILGGTARRVSQHFQITNILADPDEQELERFDGPKLSDLQQLSPEERADIAFQMDAQEMGHAFRQLRDQGHELQAFYHSHTHSPARPSQTDITIALEFEQFRAKINLPQPLHLIISLENEQSPVIKAYAITTDDTTEIPVMSADE